jgi:hypothetical protein
MFDTRRKFTGTEHTTTVILLIVAFVFSLPVLAVSRPFGTALFSMAMAYLTIVSAPVQPRSLQTIGTV